MTWLTAHLTLPYLLTLVVGIILGSSIGQVVDYVRRRRGKPVEHQSPVVVVASLVIVLTMVWIMVSTQQARDCAMTLNVAVSNEQGYAKIERDAFAKAIVASQAVPADIQALPQTDPRRKAYMDPITAEYMASMKEASDGRARNVDKQQAAQRACGST